MSEDGLRAIVVGAGFWGQKWIAALTDNPNAQIAGVVAGTSQTLERVQREFDIERDCSK